MRIERQRIRQLAHAMRLASVLARIETPKLGRHRANADYSARDVGVSADWRAWPEIDCDPLFVGDEDEYFPFDDCKRGPATWPIDVAMALPFNADLLVLRASTVSPKALRGRATRFSRFTVDIASLEIDQTAASVKDWGDGTLGLFGGKWTSVLTRPGNYAFPFKVDNERCQFPAIALGHALRQRYTWASIFEFPSGLRLRFGCSARGALELYRDRDKADDETRRRALLHWVGRHWRRSSTAEELRAVRQHLRGVSRISWRGMDVTIIPAEYELEAAA